MNFGNATFSVIDERSAPPALFLALYDEILKPSFPAEELVDRSELVEAIADPDERVCASLVVGPNAVVMAGMVGEWFGGSGVLLESYVAVRPGLRGSGIGTKMVQATVQGWIKRFDPMLVVGEVEDPRHYFVSRYGDPVARLRFYSRLGGKVLPLPYFQPALRDGCDRVYNLLLMTFVVSPRCLVGPDLVRASTVETFLQENIVASEGAIEYEDDDVRRLLAAARGKDGLRLQAPALYLA
ncbi:MAG TPA: GNAT family N-acetyltransferase [Aldersonia sp.]